MGTVRGFLLIALISVRVLAADEVEREIPLPIVRLDRITSFDSVEFQPPSTEEVERIERLIGELTMVRRRDFALLVSPSFSTVFLPLGVWGDFAERIDTTHSHSHPALRKLVAIGPAAIPNLLKSLDDERPTQLLLKVESGQRMSFAAIFTGNPINPTEQSVLRLGRRLFSEIPEPTTQIAAYRVKVGDICYLALGQIVGRAYVPVFPLDVKLSGYVISSPVHDRQLRNRIRRIWATTHPERRLLESLALDFSTRGVFAGESLDNWDAGNDIQLRAVIRMLFYFPDQSAELICDRLAQLQISQGDYIDQCVKNGIRAEDLINAVSWSRNEKIIAALQSLANRSPRQEVKKALQRASMRSN